MRKSESGKFFYPSDSFSAAGGNDWFSFWKLILAICTLETVGGQVIAAIGRFILGGIVLPYNFVA